MTANQVIGIVLANWCTRNSKDPKIIIEARELIAADPAEHHAVCPELSWLLRSHEPSNKQKAEEFLRLGEELLTQQFGRSKKGNKDVLFKYSERHKGEEIAFKEAQGFCW